MVSEKMERASATKSCILYILKHVDGGRKKLMKLMFLVDYYDTSNNKLTLNKAIGNQFFVYHYGVFSREVMDGILELIKSGKVIESHYGKLEINPSTTVDIKNKDLKSKVDAVIKEFGKLEASKLETETLQMIKLTKESKYASFGMMVDAILVSQ